MKNSCECTSDNSEIHCVAATDGENAAIMITHYSATKNIAEKNVTVHLDGAHSEGEWMMYFLDENRTMEEVRVKFNNGEISLAMPENSVVLLKKIF